MKAASLRDLKVELKDKSKEELLELCLKFARFKKENKELLSYLLYDSDNETGYINDVKLELDQQFSEINYSSVYLTKKGVRKVLKNCKKYIRYSKNKQTEVELLLYYSRELLKITRYFQNNVTLLNIFYRQIEFIKKKTQGLHEDLQFDYNNELEELIESMNS